MRKKSQVFRLLLKLYPADFRKHYGEDMEEMFCSDLQACPGLFSRGVNWCRGILDLIWRAPRQRFSRPGSPHWAGSGGMASLIAEFRQGGRRLTRQKWTSLLSILVVASGIAAATSAFALLRGVVLAPLPYPDAQRLVRIFQAGRGEKPSNPYQRTYQSVIRDARTLAATAVIRNSFRVFLDGSQVVGAEQVPVQETTVGFFSLLGVPPLLGGWPVEGSEENVVVLSHRFWMSHFAGNPEVIGRTIRLLEIRSDNVQSRRVVAVMPSGFGAELLPSSNGPELWLPVKLLPPTPRVYWSKPVIARVADRTSLLAVVAELNQRLEGEPSDERESGSLSVIPLQEAVVGAHGRLFWMLFAAVTCLLAICGLNFTGLLVANLRLRRSEMAIRKALGARLPRLLGTLLAESVPLSLAGALLGCGLSFWTLPLILNLTPHSVPRLQTVSLSSPVLLFSLLASLLLGLLAALLSLPWSPNLDLLHGLSRGLLAHRAGNSRLALVLVTGEMVLAVLLLFGGSLVTNSLLRLYLLDPGYRTHDILSFELLQPVDFSGGGVLAMQGKKREVLERIRAIPGVEMAAVGPVPFRGYGSTDVVREGEQEIEPVQVLLNDVSSDFLRLLDIDLLRGRPFTEADRADSPPVAIINQSLASRLWPGQDPLGKRLTTNPDDPGWITVIGLARDIRRRSLERAPEPEMYLPYRQCGDYSSETFLVRAGGDLDSVRKLLREAISAWNPQRTIDDIHTLEELMGEMLAERRFVVWLLNSFSGISLLLAGAGLYSVTAALVADRTREVGLRMALGAEARDIFRLFLRWGLRITAIGLLLGLPLAWASSRLLERWLFRAETGNFLSLLLVVLTAVSVALSACLLPSWRASRLDPLIALHRE